MRSVGSLQAVLFDAGNTLVFPNSERILEPLQRRGVVVSDEQLWEVERVAKLQLDEAILSSGKVDSHFWETYYQRLLAGVGIEDPGLVRELVPQSQRAMNWDRVLPGTAEVLARLGAKYTLGVISNSDGQISQLLESVGLARYFRTIVDSTRVGHEKPDGRIFAAALADVDTPAERALYVGDVYSIDYLGARNAGMQSVLMDVSGTYAAREVNRVESLDQLEQALSA